MIDTQKKMILSHLQRGGGITAIDALNRYGCLRLAARIMDLRNDGHAIKTEMLSVPVPGGRVKQFARYTLPIKVNR